MNRIVRIIGMGILLVAAFDCAAGSRRQTNAATLAPQQTGQEMAATVKIDNFSFSPATLEIKAGTTVTWTNADDIPHTVVNDDKISNQRRSTRMKNFRSNSTRRERIPIFVRSIRR